MVLANRPWKLVSDLSKMIAATLATAAFLVVDANAWGSAISIAWTSGPVGTTQDDCRAGPRQAS